MLHLSLSTSIPICSFVHLLSGECFGLGSEEDFDIPLFVLHSVGHRMIGRSKAVNPNDRLMAYEVLRLPIRPKPMSVMECIGKNSFHVIRM